jgi:drug/metabolite transporter (DMT)-like permease
MNPHRDKLRGIVLAITGFTCWVFADSTIKLLGSSRLPPHEIIAFMGLFLSGTIALYAAFRRNVAALKPRNAAHQAIRSCLDLANNVCVVIALRHVSLPLFYILVFMAPLVVTVLGAVLIKERIGFRKAAATAAGFLGVVIAVNPFASTRQGDWIGFAACMVCVACFSVNMVWSRVLTRTETPESLTFFSGIVMAIVGFAAMLWHSAPIGTKWLYALLAMGIFCAAGSICFFLALQRTTASNVSQYHYTQLITGSIVSYAIWRQLPTVFMIIGGAIIALAGLFVAVGMEQDPAAMH